MLMLVFVQCMLARLFDLLIPSQIYGHSRSNGVLIGPSDVSVWLREVTACHLCFHDCCPVAHFLVYLRLAHPRWQSLMAAPAATLYHVCIYMGRMARFLLHFHR